MNDKSLQNRPRFISSLQLWVQMAFVKLSTHCTIQIHLEPSRGCRDLYGNAVVHTREKIAPKVVWYLNNFPNSSKCRNINLWTALEYDKVVKCWVAKQSRLLCFDLAWIGEAETQVRTIHRKDTDILTHIRRTQQEFVLESKLTSHFQIRKTNPSRLCGKPGLFRCKSCDGKWTFLLTSVTWRHLSLIVLTAQTLQGKLGIPESAQMIFSKKKSEM